MNDESNPRNQEPSLRTIAPRLMELYLWMFLAFIASGRFWISYWRNLTNPHVRISVPEFIAAFYFDLLLGAIVMLFPILFVLIFGSYPLEHIRTTRKMVLRRRSGTSVESEPTAENAGQPRVAESLATGLEADSPEDYLKNLAYSSRRLSEGIYTRAGVYLLIGVLIAFTGLVFFYSQSGKLSDIHEVSNLLVNLVPRVGILFFIELIAFFFLRQYRIAMDEFRYFEAIKRNREETLALVRLAKTGIEGLNITELLAKSSFYSHPGKLAAGESTELVETRKLDKNELELVGKLIDILGKSHD